MILESLQNPVILVILGFLGFLAFLGFLVVLRILQKLLSDLLCDHGSASARKGLRKLPAPAVPLLDEFRPCPACKVTKDVRVRRGTVAGIPFVEHFVCGPCGRGFMGPAQQREFQKRCDARDKVRAELGRNSEKPKT